MRAAEHWKDFEVLDTSGGEKLERWGNVILARPDPQIIWNTPKGDSWKKINARYLRSRSGGGQLGSAQYACRQLDYRLPGADLQDPAHRLQAHRAFPGAGGELGLHGGEDPGCPERGPQPGDQGAQPLCLYRRRHHCLQCGRRVRSAMWTPPRAWWPGPGKTRPCPAWQDRPIRWIVDDCLKFVAPGDPPGQPV